MGEDQLAFQQENKVELFYRTATLQCTLVLAGPEKRHFSLPEKTQPSRLSILSCLIVWARSLSYRLVICKVHLDWEEQFVPPS